MSRPATRESQCLASRQRGIALIVLLVLLGLLVGTLVVGFTGDLARQNKKQKQTTEALAKAKEALIGRAASDSSIPGSLPCPDLVTNIPGTNIPNDGIADLFAGNNCPSYVGRLPWRTLGLPDLRDGDGERLWYALSQNFRDHPSAQPLNSDTAGQLVITGMAPAVNIIAIVFSPGAVVGNQVRDPANENNVANYLEGENSNGSPPIDNTFVTAQATNAFNDGLLPITSDALFAVVEMRVLREMRNALVAYRSNPLHPYFPGANPYSDGTYSCDYFTYQGRLPLNINLGCTALADWGTDLPTWFGANNWQNVTYYAVSPCQIGVGAALPGLVSVALAALCGLTPSLSVDGNPSVDALVFTAGSRIAAVGQSRPCASVSGCLEGSENTNGDPVFTSPIRSATNNDRLLIVWP